MNLQEIYDTVKAHLLKQGRRASDVCGGTCYYRTKEYGSDATLKCAVGCLIPDELYDPEIEGVGITDIWGLGPDELPPKTRALYYILDKSLGGIDRQKLGLLISLQTTHDGCRVETWRETLESHAEQRNLKP